MATEDRATRLVRVLSASWEAIRARHPEVPAVVVVIGAGSNGGRRRGELLLGHFAATRWHDGAGDDAVVLPEVFIGGEGLREGAANVLDTLLHEAAHALAHVRGVQDTSRQGRYHNKRYAALARELGMNVREAGTLGWSDTTVPDTTVQAYQDVVDDLVPALTLWRRSETSLTAGGVGGSGGARGDSADTGAGDDQAGNPADPAAGADGRKDTNLRPCICPCGRRLRVAAGTLAAGPILCGLCEGEFHLVVT
jgi:hypothetical protein